MDIVFRAVVIFCFLWLVIRITGKRQISQLSAFDLIMLITVGDLIGQSVIQEDYSLTAGVLAVVTFALLSIALSWSSFRFPRLRPLLEGRPHIIVRDGTPDLDVLRAERLALDDLYEAARQQGIRDVGEIDLCVLETNGTFSFFRRPDVARNDTQRDGSADDTRQAL